MMRARAAKFASRRGGSETPCYSGDSIAEAVAAVARKLADAGIDGASTDARLLVQDATGLSREALLRRSRHRLNESEAARLAALAARRAGREPVSHVLGRREFWSLEFRITRDCLDPRPDSETIVEAALARLDGRAQPLRLLDLGTGSGCLLLALLSELPQASGLGIDASEAALAVARENAERLGFSGRARFVAGNWGHGVGGTFDAIVANPPYVESGEIDTLAPEIAHYEPRLALDGGPDGLDAYRALLPDIAHLLAPAGFAAIEIGATQRAAVARLAETAGLVCADVRRDLAGHERCLVLAAGAVNAL
jgi:release factor glutamine methyltransferase